MWSKKQNSTHFWSATQSLVSFSLLWPRPFPPIVLPSSPPPLKYWGHVSNWKCWIWILTDQMCYFPERATIRTLSIQAQATVSAPPSSRSPEYAWQKHKSITLLAQALVLNKPTACHNLCTPRSLTTPIWVHCLQKGYSVHPNSCHKPQALHSSLLSLWPRLSMCIACEILTLHMQIPSHISSISFVAQEVCKLATCEHGLHNQVDVKTRQFALKLAPSFYFILW